MSCGLSARDQWHFLCECPAGVIWDKNVGESICYITCIRGLLLTILNEKVKINCSAGSADIRYTSISSPWQIVDGFHKKIFALELNYLNQSIIIWKATKYLQIIPIAMFATFGHQKLWGAATHFWGVQDLNTSINLLLW